MHITFNFGEISQFPSELMGKEFVFKVVGYSSDGKNSGFQVEIPEELKEYYTNVNAPHITVSLGEVDGVKGKAVDTGKLNFEKIDEPFEIPGRLGYFIFGKGVRLDNSIFVREHTAEEIKLDTKDVPNIKNTLEVLVGNEGKGSGPDNH